MIITCVCGQKNQLPADLVSAHDARTTPRRFRCGACKEPFERDEIFHVAFADEMAREIVDDGVVDGPDPR